MINEFLQALITDFDTYVTAKNIGLLLMAAAPIFAVGMIGSIVWHVCVDSTASALSKEERAKGFDFVDLKNPRNIEIYFDARTKKEISDAEKWKTKSDFVLGKEFTDQLIKTALYAKYGREYPGGHTNFNVHVELKQSPDEIKREL